MSRHWWTGGVRMAEFTINRAMWKFVGRGLLLGAAVGIVFTFVDVKFRLNQPVVLALGAPIVIGTLIQLVRLGVADTPPPLRTPPPPAAVPEYFMRLRQLERRLEVAADDPADYEWSIRPMLAQLAADRLVYRHGIRYQTQPDRARQIVGEQLWEIMTPPLQAPIRSVDRARLTDLVSQIERI